MAALKRLDNELELEPDDAGSRRPWPAGFSSFERCFGEPDGEGEEVAVDGGEKRRMKYTATGLNRVMVPRRGRWDGRLRTFVSFYIQSSDCASGNVLGI